MKGILAKYDNLKQEWDARNLDQVTMTLAELKVELTEVSFLPTEEGEAKKDKKALLVARKTLEIGAEHSVATENVEMFERYMAILKSYYSDYADILDESPKKYELLGLNLLCLLSQNHTAEFHTELELLPPDVLLNNPYISYPVKLEQFIMEGSYNKVIDDQHYIPAPSYEFFIQRLLVTIRDEIASCMEKSYGEITASECQKMLNVEQDEFENIAKVRGWVVSGSKVKFVADNKQNFANEIPSQELANMAITYAKEMEQIV